MSIESSRRRPPPRESTPRVASCEFGTVGRLANTALSYTRTGTEPPGGRGGCFWSAPPCAPTSHAGTTALRTGLLGAATPVMSLNARSGAPRCATPDCACGLQKNDRLVLLWTSLTTSELAVSPRFLKYDGPCRGNFFETFQLGSEGVQILRKSAVPVQRGFGYAAGAGVHEQGWPRGKHIGSSHGRQCVTSVRSLGP